ncbi:MAG: hypothetical protein ACI3XA_09095 [Clostridia bacterium]
MPLIGIIRGTGEGYYSTGYLIKIIRALNKRFRSKIKFLEIPLGDREKYGYELNHEAIDKITGCDCLFVGDFSSFSNDVDYSIDDIVMALSCDTASLSLNGTGKDSSVNVCIHSYFDGGTNFRDGQKTVEGTLETRVCSAYSAMNIVKYISRKCQERRRRMYFVQDSENEFLSDMFYKNFESYIMPQSNFHLYKYEIKEICTEILRRPNDFDTLFASKTATDAIWGIYSGLLGGNLASYTFYGRNFPVYHVKSVCANLSSEGETPSLSSYIIALADMLYAEFGQAKEQASLRGAVEILTRENYSVKVGDMFTELVIEELQKKVPTKYTKRKNIRKFLT